MFSTAEVIRITQSIASDFAGDTSESPDAIFVEIRRGAKKICLDWPKHDLAEVWMTFYDGDHETGLYQDWFECMGADDKDEFVAYTRTVAARFLEHPSRLKKRGLIFGRWVLEVQIGEGWHNIFDPELDLQEASKPS